MHLSKGNLNRQSRQHRRAGALELRKASLNLVSAEQVALARG
jgi:hypothetical protein